MTIAEHYSSMPSSRFIAQYHVESLVRLNALPYLSGEPIYVMELGLPRAKVAVHDNLVRLGELLVPQGLLLNVEIEAEDDGIDQAIKLTDAVVGFVLSVLACVAMAGVGPARLIWIYNSTADLIDRDYRTYYYNDYSRVGCRPLNIKLTQEFLRMMYDDFNVRSDIRSDFKERVYRAIWTFRRALAEDGDVLTQFMTHWASMEGMDCVYRDVFPSSQAKFMDGVRCVLGEVGGLGKFDSLKQLRDKLAHGDFTLSQAIQTASDNIVMIRKSHLLMILRILGAGKDMCDSFVGNSYLNTGFEPRMEFGGTIRFVPVSVSNFFGQPRVDVEIDGFTVEPNGETLIQRPNFRCQPRNLVSMQIKYCQMWDQDGANIRYLDLQASVGEDRAHPSGEATPEGFSGFSNEIDAEECEDIDSNK